MISIIANIEFESWWPLVLLPLPLAVYFMTAPIARRDIALRVPFYSRLASFVEQRAAVQHVSVLRAAALALVWLACLLAMCRPVLVGEAVVQPSKARDLFLAVDISGSMEERDMSIGSRPVRRIDMVKHVLSDFIQRREGDRIGLILFADKAYVQAPLTFDTHTVDQLMQQAQLGFAGQKTAIGDAIGLGIKQLTQRPNESRTLILLTDGASNAGQIDPLEAAGVARENAITVYTIGIGSEATTFRGLFGSSIIPSRSRNIDEQTLRKIAQQTGGQYFRADNSSELASVYQQLDRLEPVDQQQQIFRPRQQIFHWPLAFACSVVFLWAIVRALAALTALAASFSWKKP